MESRCLRCDESRLLVGIVLVHEGALLANIMVGALHFVDETRSVDTSVVGKVLILDSYDTFVRNQSNRILFW